MLRGLRLALPITMLCGGVVAQDAAIDVNADGMYSFAEVQAVMPGISEENFAVIDTSGDGLLDADEIALGVQAGLLPG